MKKSIACCLALILSGCCPPPTFKVESEFRSYVNDFRVHYGTNEGVNVVRGDLPGTVLGQCELSDTPGVIIDGEYWDQALEHERESLIYHELGHCLLRRAHVNTIGKDRCPTSLMYYTNAVNDCYKLKREQYLEELGTKRNTLTITFVGIIDEALSTW